MKQKELEDIQLEFEGESDSAKIELLMNEVIYWRASSKFWSDLHIKEIREQKEKGKR
jgi:hypothetical protein